MDTSHGWAAAKSAGLQVLAGLFAVALVPLCAGCRSNSSDPFLAQEEQSTARAGSAHGGGEHFATRPLAPDLLASDHWFEKPPASYAKRTETDMRWHHPRLDPYLHPQAPRSDLADQLLSSSSVVATNAAIVTAHWNTGEPTAHLAAAIRADKLPLSLRCAAAEALGLLEKPSPAPTLRALLLEFAPVDLPQSTADEKKIRPEIPDLHADLIRALARHAEPGDEKWFTAALASRAWQVRLEGVAAWSALSDLSLPAQVIELRGDRDPRVRATAVRTIAAHRDPQAVAYLQQALDDSDFDVRVAAMTALDEIGTRDAKALVGQMKNRGAEIQQAAVEASRAAMGFGDEVQAAAKDTHSQLRLAVAETLDEAERRGQQLAAETVAVAQEAADQSAAQVKQVADATSQRVREAQRLVAALREANLPEAVRREAAVALERLAMDADVAVRVEAARAMGQAADPSLLPALMALLSDEADVQVAAMASLAAIAGSDVTAREAGRPLSNEERIRLWQLWYRERQDKMPAAR